MTTGPRRQPIGPGGIRGPTRDLRPSAPSASSFHLADALASWRTEDQYTTKSIATAAVTAEETVQPVLASRRERRFARMSAVQLRFSDVRTLESFRRTRAVAAISGEDIWRLERRWYGAEGDGGLDEAMCGGLARVLNADFAGLLAAEAVPWIIKAP